ncbi:MAG: hypothetical protein ACON3Z_16460 [Bradymonadia bacterium]
MIACTACGHQGEPKAVRLATFKLDACVQCGFGLGIEPMPTETQPAVSLVVGENPSTGEVELSPTAAFTLDDLNQRPSVRQKTHRVVVVTNDRQLFDQIDSALAEATDPDCEFAARGNHAVEQLISANETKTALILLIDTNNDDFPALQLGHTVRALETALNMPHSMICMVGELTETEQEALTNIDARHEIGHGSEQPNTLAALVRQQAKA